MFEASIGFSMKYSKGAALCRMLVYVAVVPVLLHISACSSVPQHKTTITIEKASQYRDVNAFLKNFISSKMDSRERSRGFDVEKLNRAGEYIYVAEIIAGNVSENLKALGWPHQQLRIYCSAQNGTWLDDTGSDSAKISKEYGTASAMSLETMLKKTYARNRDPELKETMLQALDKHAFGVKACKKASQDLWRVKIMPGGRRRTPYGITYQYVRVRSLGTNK